MKKLLALTLALVLAVSLFTILPSAENDLEKKLDLLFDDEYESSKLVVAIKHEYSGFTKEWSKNKILMGDADGNRVIDSSDVTRALNASVGSVTLTEQQRMAVDLNDDGTVSTAEVLKLQQYVNGTVDSLW